MKKNKNTENTIKSRSDKYKNNKKHSKDIQKKYKNKDSVYSNLLNSNDKLNDSVDNSLKFKKPLIIIGISIVGVISFFGLNKFFNIKFGMLEKFSNPVVVEDRVVDIPGLKTIQEVKVIDTKSSLDFINDPVFLTQENNIEYDKIVLEDLEAENAPSLYTKVILNGNDFGMFIFTDGNGDYKYRCYASRKGEKENDSAKYYGFVDVEFEPQDNGEFKITPISDEFVDTAQDTFGQVAPLEVSEDDLPDIYHYADDNSNKKLFYFIDKNGNKEYRVFGAFEDKIPHYYPALESTGEMIPGSLYVDVSTDKQNAATYEELQELGIDISPVEELER